MAVEYSRRQRRVHHPGQPAGEQLRPLVHGGAGGSVLQRTKGRRRDLAQRQREVLLRRG